MGVSLGSQVPLFPESYFLSGPSRDPEVALGRFTWGRRRCISGHESPYPTPGPLDSCLSPLSLSQLGKVNKYTVYLRKGRKKKKIFLFLPPSSRILSEVLPPRPTPPSSSPFPSFLSLGHGTNTGRGRNLLGLGHCPPVRPTLYRKSMGYSSLVLRSL